MHLEHLTEQNAKNLHGFHKTWIVYRRLNDGSYVSVGKLAWNLNYNAIPIKQKYWKLIFFSGTDYGREVKPE